MQHSYHLAAWSTVSQGMPRPTSFIFCRSWPVPQSITTTISYGLHFEKVTDLVTNGSLERARPPPEAPFPAHSHGVAVRTVAPRKSYNTQ